MDQFTKSSQPAWTKPPLEIVSVNNPVKFIKEQKIAGYSIDSYPVHSCSMHGHNISILGGKNMATSFVRIG
jgi:hypothetical protein